MVRFEIQVIEANGLPVADAGGTSDPYLEVCTSAERQKTQVVKKTLSPVWRETKIVSVMDPRKDAIGFLVFDWDRMSCDDVIAYSFISVMNVPTTGMPLDVWIDLYKKSKKAQKQQKKAAKSGKIPKPTVPGGRLHIIIRALDVTAPPPMAMPPQGYYPPQPMPGQPMPGQPMPGQPYYPPQPMPGQPMPGQPMPGQPMPGQPYYPPQPMPGQPMPGQPYYPPQPMSFNLQVPIPYAGAPPLGFQNKSGYLRPKKTDGEVATKVAGKGAKKTLKALGKFLS